MSQKKSEFTVIGSLWPTTDEAHGKHLAGTWDGNPLKVVKNTARQGDRQPAWLLTLCDIEIGAFWEKESEKMGKFFSFILVILFISLLNWVFVYALSELLGIYYLISIVAAAFIISVLNYAINRMVVFK